MDLPLRRTTRLQLASTRPRRSHRPPCRVPPPPPHPRSGAPREPAELGFGGTGPRRATARNCSRAALCRRAINRPQRAGFISPASQIGRLSPAPRETAPSAPRDFGRGSPAPRGAAAKRRSVPPLAAPAVGRTRSAQEDRPFRRGVLLCAHDILRRKKPPAPKTSSHPASLEPRQARVRLAASRQRGVWALD